MLDPPRKDKMSLSRDSGLTMSDSQLYTPDEEESTSSSSSGSGRGVYSNNTPIHGNNYNQHNKVSGNNFFTYTVHREDPELLPPSLSFCFFIP